ncbi:MAG: ComF family protein [Lachnospiraceae bacterium]|nr:ComF family protein [Lachnospiraceae bacterium]
MYSILEFLYPPRCPICDGVRFSDEPVCCPSCIEQVSYVSAPYCMCCGRPIERDDREFCYDCSRKKRNYSGGVSLGAYEGALKESVLRFKFHGREEFASWYAEKLTERYEKELFRFHATLILPVPMHKRKERRRGYNQAASLAKELSERLSVPVRSDILLRTRYTEPQKNLNDVARLQNLLNAFAVEEEKLTEYKKNHSIERVILVDDIYTTGSTMEACARVLKKAGVERIMPVTIAVAGGYTE